MTMPPTVFPMLRLFEKPPHVEAVGCKDWLTNKVDRCVTGRVAQQQTCG